MYVFFKRILYSRGRKGKKIPIENLIKKINIDEQNHWPVCLCVFLDIASRVKISTGLDQVCLAHNETPRVCTK